MKHKNYVERVQPEPISVDMISIEMTRAEASALINQLYISVSIGSKYPQIQELYNQLLIANNKPFIG